ncbi:hypothetical protein B0H14DRAFT_3898633, partial [Mycena olivaceomarginata]
MTNSYKKKPTAKRSLAQREQLAKTQAARRHNSQNVPPTSRPTKNTLQKDLKNTRKVLSATQERLHATERQLALTTTQLSRTQSTLISVQNNYTILTTNNADLYRLLRNERRTTQRYAAAKRDLKGEITGLSSALESAEKERALAIFERDRARASEAQILLRMREILDHSDTEVARLKNLLQRSRQKTRSLQMKALRLQRSHARDKLRLKNEKALQSSKSMRWDLTKGGAYTADARAMARELVNAGCSQEKVGSIIQYVGQKAGRSVKKKMSRRTVQRALMEGGVAARIQLAHEMADAD